MECLQISYMFIRKSNIEIVISNNQILLMEWKLIWDLKETIPFWYKSSLTALSEWLMFVITPPL